MCKACKMDPREVARMYERQGAVEVEDFDKEVNYQTRMTGRGYKRKYKREKTRPGCPENDYKAHVYVWTSEGLEPNFFSDYYGFHKYAQRVCAGCGKRNGSDLSEKYMAIKERRWAKKATPEKGVPISRWRYARSPYVRFRWWAWENEDADYMAARREYIDRHGWPSYMYNQSW